MKAVIHNAAGTLLGVLLIAVGTALWQRASDGSLIDAFGGATGEQVAVLTERVNGLTDRLDGLTDRLDSLAERVALLSGRVAGLEGNTIQELTLVEGSIPLGDPPPVLSCPDGWQPTGIRFHESYRADGRNNEKHTLVCAR